MKTLIVTHVPPHHLDDYLAVSLLLAKYGDGAEVRKVRSFSRTDAEALLNQYDLVIAVDVGGELMVNDRLRIYDHHQDRNLPSSFHLVLKHEFPEIYKVFQRVEPLRKLLEYADVRDTRGPVEAARLLGLDPSSEAARLLNLLLTVAVGEPNAVVGEGLLRLAKAYEKVERLVRVIKVGDVKVAVTHASPRELPAPVIFEATNADLLVQPNVRNPQHTSIVKNAYSPLYQRIDLAKLATQYPIVFKHPSGFMVVVAKTSEEVEKELEKIVKIATG